MKSVHKILSLEADVGHKIIILRSLIYYQISGYIYTRLKELYPSNVRRIVNDVKSMFITGIVKK